MSVTDVGAGFSICTESDPGEAVHLLQKAVVSQVEASCCLGLSRSTAVGADHTHANRPSHQSVLIPEDLPPEEANPQHHLCRWPWRRRCSCTDMRFRMFHRRGDLLEQLTDTSHAPHTPGAVSTETEETDSNKSRVCFNSRSHPWACLLPTGVYTSMMGMSE